MSAQAKSLGLKINFIDAIDGQDLKETELDHYNREWRQKLGHPLKINEIACSMSHQKALRRFLQSGHEFAVVLEDDVTIQPDLFSTFEACANISGWDVLHLGIQYQYKGRYNLQESPEGLNIFVPCKVTRGAIGFAYSRKGAEKVLLLNETIHYPFDKQMALSYKSGIRHLAVLPAPIEAIHGESTIGDDRWNREQLTQRQSLYNKIFSRVVLISHSFGIRLNQFNNYRFFRRHLRNK